MDVKSNTTFHYWASKKFGLMMSTSKNCPTNKPKRDGKITYMGFTNDADWPKRLNTGRLLYRNNSIKRGDTRKK